MFYYPDNYFPSINSSIKGYYNYELEGPKKEGIRGYNEKFKSLNSIYPNIIYTYRYITKYNIYILNELIQKYEYEINNKINYNIPKNLNILQWEKLNNEKYIIICENLIKTFNSMFNSKPSVLIFNNKNILYNINKKNKRFLIPIKINKFYNYNKYYNEDEPNIEEKHHYMIYLLIKGNINIKNICILYDIYQYKIPRNIVPKIKKLQNYYNKRTYVKSDITTDDYINKVLKKREKKMKKNINTKCFVNGKSIKNINNEIDCIINNGVWDYPCEQNIDCPFYQKNLNYPNNFGGCNKNTGYCELPYGMKNKSYKHKFHKFKPKCYNCINGDFGNMSIGECCDEQLNNTLYPNLKSPDYTFINDTQLRKQYNTIFKNNKLNWFKY